MGLRTHCTERRWLTPSRPSDMVSLPYAYQGHLLVENRHGLIVNTRLIKATGTTEREAGFGMIDDGAGKHRTT